MKELTKQQREAIRPYLKRLLRRFRMAAKNGETRHRCPLCEASKNVGVMSCLRCPVFSRWEMCVKYIPPIPPFTHVLCEEVFTEEDEDDLVTQGNLCLTKEWAAEVVAILEGLS